MPTVKTSTMKAKYNMNKNKHAKAFETNKLKKGEKVLDCIEGYIGDMMGKGKDTQHNGSLILTNDRVSFYRKGFFGEVIRNIPLRKISSVDYDSTLGHKTIELHATYDSIRFKSFMNVNNFVGNLDEVRQ